MATTTAAASQSELILPQAPHQPLNFSFPMRQFGSRNVNRCFQPIWFSKWPFLHYDESRDLVFCHVCMKADQTSHKIRGSNADAAFVSLLLCIIKILYLIILHAGHSWLFQLERWHNMLQKT